MKSQKQMQKHSFPMPLHEKSTMSDFWTLFLINLMKLKDHFRSGH